jgi:hypothetical protein
MQHTIIIELEYIIIKVTKDGKTTVIKKVAEEIKEDKNGL